MVNNAEMDPTQVKLFDVFGWTINLAAVVIAALGVVVVMGGIFAFFHVSHKTAKIAKETAESIAKITAETAANTYMQANLQAIFQEYITLMQGASDTQANEIANAESSDETA